MAIINLQADSIRKNPGMWGGVKQKGLFYRFRSFLLSLFAPSTISGDGSAENIYTDNQYNKWKKLKTLPNSQKIRSMIPVGSFFDVLIWTS